MESDTEPLDETGTETRDADEARRAEMAAARKLVGLIVGAILIFLAQRDLRKRSPELVRGPVGLWKVLAMVPPGAVGYLLIGRRRAAVETAVVATNSAAA